jgi:hypothetical protein
MSSLESQKEIAITEKRLHAVGAGRKKAAESHDIRMKGLTNRLARADVDFGSYSLDRKEAIRACKHMQGAGFEHELQAAIAAKPETIYESVDELIQQKQRILEQLQHTNLAMQEFAERTEQAKVRRDQMRQDFEQLKFAIQIREAKHEQEYSSLDAACKCKEQQIEQKIKILQMEKEVGTATSPEGKRKELATTRCVRVEEERLAALLAEESVQGEAAVVEATEYAEEQKKATIDEMVLHFKQDFKGVLHQLEEERKAGAASAVKLRQQIEELQNKEVRIEQAKAAVRQQELHELESDQYHDQVCEEKLSGLKSSVFDLWRSLHIEPSVSAALMKKVEDLSPFHHDIHKMYVGQKRKLQGMVPIARMIKQLDQVKKNQAVIQQYLQQPSLLKSKRALGELQSILRPKETADVEQLSRSFVLCGKESAHISKGLSKELRHFEQVGSQCRCVRYMSSHGFLCGWQVFGEAFLFHGKPYSMPV